MVTPWPCRSFHQASNTSASMPRAKWPGQLAPCGGNWSPFSVASARKASRTLGLANPKEDVTARLLAHDPQAQDRPLEGFRSLEVIDVYGSFDNGPDLHDGLRLFRPLPIQFTQLPRPQRQPEGHQNQKPHEQLEYAHEPQ